MNANFTGKGASPPMNFCVRKLESLGYRMVKKIAENFNRLSRVHQRFRRQTDGRPIAYSEHERKYHFAKNDVEDHLSEFPFVCRHSNDNKSWCFKVLVVLCEYQGFI